MEEQKLQSSQIVHSIAKQWYKSPYQSMRKYFGIKLYWWQRVALWIAWRKAKRKDARCKRYLRIIGYDAASSTMHFCQ